MDFIRFKLLTRFEQTLFGLPILSTALLIPFLQGMEWEKGMGFRVMWILLAFMAARISGMSFNQLIDRKFDALNPRTQNRPLPKGIVTPKEAKFVTVAGAVLFLIFALQLNHLTFLFSLGAALLIFLYSYMKRIHFICHFVIGLIHMLTPVMTVLALTGSFSLPSLILGLAALCSLTAGDIVYAIQDLSFDKSQSLHSIPSRLGLKASMVIAKTLQTLALLFLSLFGLILHLHGLFYLSIPLIAFLFFRFHRHWRQDPSQFFTSSVGIGLVIFTSTLAAYLCALW